MKVIATSLCGVRLSFVCTQWWVHSGDTAWNESSDSWRCSTRGSGI